MFDFEKHLCYGTNAARGSKLFKWLELSGKYMYHLL